MEMANNTLVSLCNGLEHIFSQCLDSLKWRDVIFKCLHQAFLEGCLSAASTVTDIGNDFRPTDLMAASSIMLTYNQSNIPISKCIQGLL